MENFIPYTVHQISDLDAQECWMIDNGYLKIRESAHFLWIERAENEIIL